MKTFSIQVLGCKVNQYESEQIAALLRHRGLVPAPDGAAADLRIVHTCSVTCEAGKKSAQMVRRATRLPVLQAPARGFAVLNNLQTAARTIVTGCWATSDPAAAAAIPGVDAVIGNMQDLGGRLAELLDQWTTGEATRGETTSAPYDTSVTQQGSLGGAISLPLLEQRQSTNQRAFLKIQDGCDAFCTYCIIPQLRPKLWSKPIDECVREAQALVNIGHVELVLTGIFLGAYGHETALRRRQNASQAEGFSPGSLGALIESLCQNVQGLRRLRLSSLEPGDLTNDLIAILRSHQECVPHFHLPLQSGSDAILRKMNRQYRRDDFLRMIDRVNQAFDRPAITTDIIVGFPGETEQEFEQTLQVVEHARFIHTHAFSYSPRPRTAAARWTRDFIAPPVANRRSKMLADVAQVHSLDFRRRFVGETVEVLVERPRAEATVRHGRCERYFDVQFPGAPHIETGAAVQVRVETVTADRTVGTVVC